MVSLWICISLFTKSKYKLGQSLEKMAHIFGKHLAFFQLKLVIKEKHGLIKYKYRLDQNFEEISKLIYVCVDSPNPICYSLLIVYVPPPLTLASAP